MQPYFFYGTLQDAEILRAVLRRPIGNLAVFDAVVSGYRAAPIHGQHYPLLVEERGAVTEGVLVHGLSRGDVDRLDWFEGKEYRTAPLDVLLVDDKRAVTALVYVSAGRLRTLPGSWSFPEWQKRHKRAFLARIKSGLTA